MNVIQHTLQSLSLWVYIENLSSIEKPRFLTTDDLSKTKHPTLNEDISSLDDWCRVPVIRKF